MIMNRRLFIGQASLLAVASGGFLRDSWAADPDYVFADTSFGRVRGVDVQGIKTFKGIPYGASTAGKEPLHAARRSCQVDRRARCAGIRTERAATQS